MPFQIQGKLIEKFDVQNVSATFKKREMIVRYESNPNFPQFIKFELKQDRCILLDNFQVEDNIEVHFNINGRKWINPEGKAVYFTTLEAFKLVALNAKQENSFATPKEESLVTSENTIPVNLPLAANPNEEPLPF